MGAYTLKSDHLAMSSTVAELDISSAEARVVSAPANRDLRRAIRRLDLRRFAAFGLALLIGLGAAWYGHQWWTVGRFIESTDDAYVGGDVTVIDAKAGTVIGTIAVGGKLEFGVTDEKGKVFVNVEDKGEIVAPCGVPSSLAFHSPSSITPALSHFPISRITR